MDQELKEVLQERVRAFEEFKSGIDTRFRDLESYLAKLRRPHLANLKADPSDPEVKAFMNYVRKGIVDNSLLEAKSNSVGSGPDGGFAVPKVIDSLIEATAVNVSPIRAIASVVQISTPDFHKLVNVHGTSSGWVGETAARPATNTPQLQDIQPPMGELYAYPQATQTMLDDVFFNADQWLADEIALEFGRAEGAAFVNGTGVNQPRGFLTYPTAAQADGTRAFGTIEYTGTGVAGNFKAVSSTVNPSDDLFTLVAKVKKPYRAGACWVMNKKTLFAVMAMKDNQGRYIFNPATAPGMSDTILNYPIVEAEDMPDYTTSGALAIAFGNFRRGYLVVDRVGTRVVRDPFSNKPYVGFYTTRRTGGALTNSEAIKVLKFS